METEIRHDTAVKPAAWEIGINGNCGMTPNWYMPTGSYVQGYRIVIPYEMSHVLEARLKVKNSIFDFIPGDYKTERNRAVAREKFLYICRYLRSRGYVASFGNFTNHTRVSVREICFYRSGHLSRRDIATPGYQRVHSTYSDERSGGIFMHFCCPARSSYDLWAADLRVFMASPDNGDKPRRLKHIADVVRLTQGC